MQTLIFDLSNIMYISGYRVPELENADLAVDLVIEQADNLMRRIYRSFEPDQVVLACDSTHYWRRDIFPEYKGNREENALKIVVKAALKKYKTLKPKICYECLGAEADDLVYGFTKYLPGNKVIVSSDKDFIQLISDTVALYCPKLNQYRRRPHNQAFELFLKCIRGDRSDNIPSAYPRVQQKRLERAFNCEKSLTQLLKIAHPDGKSVREHYLKNKTLIDLSCVPHEIEDLVREEILSREAVEV